LTSAQAHVTVLESREAIAVEALKQAKDEHVQKLMEAYLVTHNQRRARGSKSPLHPTLFKPIRSEDPQILEGHPSSIKERRRLVNSPEGAIVLEGIPVFPQAMNKQEHPNPLKIPRRSCLSPYHEEDSIQHHHLKSRKKLQAPPRQHRPPSGNHKSQSNLKKSSTPCCHLSRRQKKSSTSARLDPSRRCLRLKVASLARREAARSEVSYAQSSACIW
ncbi:hypothetical protein Zm00014a_019094, partial [Zea mays]